MEEKAGKLVLYNTRTGEKEVFSPIEPGHVRMYTCGPTVYSPQHIGNLRSQLFADLLKRTLLAEGYQVTHVINITDVGHLTDDADAGEDQMEDAARRSGRRAQNIAAEYTEQWRRDRERVGCLEPEVLCRATDHIPEQIELARRLEEKGYTYRIEDGIYFDTSKFPAYGELAGLNREEEGVSRIGDVAGKHHPADFALWKFPPRGVTRQQEWDSPWGRGFPGWHIECSAMSSRYLGVQFDIHTGGVDHIKVHHPNEIAQSECAYDVRPWVNFWMHHEFLSFDREKMSKSKGSVLVLDDLVARGFAPRAYRYFFLQAHYRQQQAFTDEAIEAAQKGYDRLLMRAIEVRGSEGNADVEKLAPYREAFNAAIRDDLNAPRAIAVAWDIARSGRLSDFEKKTLLLELDQVLGLDLARAVPKEMERESDPRIEALLEKRAEARSRRDWAEADRIRTELAREGILLEDGPQGTRWKRARISNLEE
jgi:cysteinyl-tRNA synthetase